MWLDPNEIDPKAIAWLNDNVLMGYIADHEKWAGQPYTMVDPEGNMTPWFASPDYQGGYTEEVPVEAVMHLFRHHVLEGPVFSYVPCSPIEADYMDEKGRPFRKVQDLTRKAIIHPETGAFFNIRKARYGIHQFDEWLVKNVANIIDDALKIGSAMLLSEGAVAAVSVELPETIVTKAGFPVRPRLLAYTSHDSTYQTTYMRSLLSPVCNNSLTIEIRRDGKAAQKWTQKHTTASTLRIASARDALAILYQQAEEMTAFIEKLSEWEVSDKQYRTLMNQLNPVPEVVLGTGDKQGQITNQRSITLANNKRKEITSLYVKDERVAPWRGTALGVLQAFNTYEQHERGIKGGSAGGTIERQMNATLSNEVGKFDAQVLNGLAEVCERELVAV